LIIQRALTSVVIGTAISSFAIAQQTKAQTKVTGIFSDLNYVEEAGDLIGMEVFIFFAGEPRVLYQESAGEPMEPSLVKARIQGDSIEFTVPQLGGGHRTFKGRITKTHLIGKFTGSRETIKLPRRSSYWQ